MSVEQGVSGACLFKYNLCLQGVSNLSISGGGGGVVDKTGMPLAAKEWYYGPISRSQCDTLLNSRGHDGDYLIRDSETNVSLTYSVVLVIHAK